MKSIRMFASCCLMLGNVLNISSFSSKAHSQCLPLSDQDRAAVVSYVSKRFHVGKELIGIIGTEPVEESCFLSIHLQALAPKRSLTLYLSPDHKHLAPDLYDMQLDPLVEERREHAALTEILNVDISPSKGARNGKITIVEFSDFQCPYCKQMAETIKTVMSEKALSTEVSLVYKNYPLPMHEWASQAAALGECTQKLSPDSFWLLHDFFFTNQESLSSDNIRDLTVDFLAHAGIVSSSELNECLANPQVAVAVERDVQLGQRLGVASTPTFFINGEKVEGAQSLPQMRAIIERVRADLSQQSSNR